MKKPASAHWLCSHLFGFLLATVTCVSGAITVTTTVPPNTTIYRCASSKVMVEMKWDGTGSSTFYQVFPKGTLITIPSGWINNAQVNFYIPVGVGVTVYPPANGSGLIAVEYDVHAPNLIMDVELDVIVPCDGNSTLDITYPSAGSFPLLQQNVPWTQNSALTAAATSFPVVTPVVQIQNFKDDAGYSGAGTIIPFNPPAQKLVVMDASYAREYDFSVAAGQVDSLSFYYSAAANTQPKRFTFTGLQNGIPAVGGAPIIFIPTAADPFPYMFGADKIATLFGTVWPYFPYEMTVLDTIHVKEELQARACSPADGSLAATTYQVTWNGCPQTLCILPGADGILQTVPGGDDVITGPVIVPNPANHRLHSIPQGDDVISPQEIRGANGGPVVNIYTLLGDDVLFAGVVKAGGNGLLETPVQAGDAIFGGMITAGADGVFQTTLQLGDVMGYVITAGANGICESLKPALPVNDDQQVTPVNQGQATPSCSTSENVQRFNSVRASTGPLAASIAIVNTATGNSLVYCAGTPASDIQVRFSNPWYDISPTLPGLWEFNPGPLLGLGAIEGDDNVPGSNMKTLDQLNFMMKQDAVVPALGNNGQFPDSAVFLEGSLPNSTATDFSVCVADLNPASGLLPFYHYDAGTHLVTLDFNVLSAAHQTVGLLPALPSNLGPLVDGFLTDGVFNQMLEGSSIWIRFAGARFDCTNAHFYPAPGLPAFKFESYPKADLAYMFFGDGSLGPYSSYFDMCGDQQQPRIHFSLHTFFPVTVAAQAANTTPPTTMPYYGGLDMLPGDTGTIDFQWAYSGGEPGASPFAFQPPPPPAVPAYFTCKPRYELKLTIPEPYTLTDAIYYQDPHKTPTGTPLDLLANYQPVVALHVLIGTLYYNVYTFRDPLNNTDPLKALTLSGHVQAKVVLNHCPGDNDPGPWGGADTFTAEVQAFCDACTTCADTIAIVSATLCKHCPHACGGNPPQGTTNFQYERLSFGKDPAGNLVNSLASTVTATSPGVERQRGYPGDRFHFSATGAMEVMPGAALSFRIEYSPEPNAPAPIDFQFFELDPVGSTLTYGVSTYNIQASDLSTTFNQPGTWANVAGFPKVLYINFTDTAVLNALHNNGSSPLGLRVDLILRIKCIGNGFTPGDYPLLMTGQFWGDAGDGKGGQPSCDPCNRFLEVLGVSSTSAFAFEPYRGGAVCHKAFEFSTTFTGGFNGGLPEFEAPENRPQVFWTTPITVDLPDGVHPCSSPYFRICIKKCLQTHVFG